MAMGHKRAKQTGFTLLELMVAIFITAVIGSISAPLLSSMTRNYIQVENQERNLAALERALQIIRSDIGQLAVRPIIQTMKHNEEPVPQVDKNQIIGGQASLEFSVFVSEPSAFKMEPRINRVRYQLIDQQLVRESINTDYPDANQQWQQHTLLDDVTMLNIDYLFTGWESSMAHNKKHPRAVRFTIEGKVWQSIELVVGMPGVDQ
jgi:general secretion pathway protein J